MSLPKPRAERNECLHVYSPDEFCFLQSYSPGPKLRYRSFPQLAESFYSVNVIKTVPYRYANRFTWCKVPIEMFLKSVSRICQIEMKTNSSQNCLDVFFLFYVKTSLFYPAVKLLLKVYVLFNNLPKPMVLLFFYYLWSDCST